MTEQNKETPAAPKQNAEGNKKPQEPSKKDETLKEGSEGSGSPKGDFEPSQEPSQKIDWEKIAQEKEKEVEQAQRALARYRKGDKDFKQKMKMGEEEEPEEEPEEGQALTEKQLRTILAEERELTRKESQSFAAEREAEALAGSKAEGRAVLAIWKSHSFPPNLSVQEQMREAFYIAHGPTLAAQLEESRRAGRRKPASGGSENVHRDPSKGKEPEISAKDKAEMDRLGYKWDGKQYIKELPSGKKLVKKSISDKPRLFI